MKYTTPGVYYERLDQNPQRIGLRRTDIAGFVGVAAQGPLHTPVKVESWRQFLTVFGERLPYAWLGYAVAAFFENGGRTCWVVRAADPAAARPARARLAISGWPALALEAASPGRWGNAITVEAVWGRDHIDRLVARTPDRRQQVLSVAQPSPDSLRRRARDPNLLDVPRDALPEFAEDVLVRVIRDAGWLSGQPLDARTRQARLDGGADGVATLRTEHLVGRADETDPETRWGVAALDRVDTIAFLAVPDLMLGDGLPAGAELDRFGNDELLDAQLAVIAACCRARDRVAILDLPRGFTPEQAVTYRQALGGSDDAAAAASFAALYHPWVLVNDPLRVAGPVRAVPPSGHVAGIYARSDRLRGVHKPPGNEVLEGVHDVLGRIDDATHGRLNDEGVNVIRPVAGRGVLLLGVRTLARDLRWRYVNVRRLVAMIEEALDEQMQWAVFEPNNPRLWSEIDRTVRGYLELLYRRGMLDGATSADAYFVHCDASTNPEAETDLGRVTCLVGLQPPFPAEFVVVRIGITRTEIEIEERGAHDA